MRRLNCLGAGYTPGNLACKEAGQCDCPAFLMGRNPQAASPSAS